VADGFLSRWSQRKQALRAGQALEEPLSKPAPSEATPATIEAPVVTALPPNDKLPALTLQDAQGLTLQSDFAPFVAREVTPEVRNAAMKKLFADPHYQVMDRLDTYIDDYSQADPIPASMLRQMASAKFLQLFEDSPEGGNPDNLRDKTAPEAGNPHDHTDLRLQQDDAAGPDRPGRGAE
jgi:Protein of unknown function (DUF3306)